MEISKALELLKEYLGELEHLHTLHHENEERRLWKNKVDVVLEAAFRKTSWEYRELNPPIVITEDNLIEEARPSAYLANLGKYELGIKKILQKYEILGVETKPVTIAKPAEAPEEYEGKTGKEIELVLEGTPDMILECVRNTVEKLNSQGHTYDFRRTSGAPDYARWDKTYFASCAISQGEEGQIGTIKLELLPKEKTLFKFLEPEDWTSSFGQFLKRLSEELKSLGFKKSVHSKVWQWLKSHKVISIIGSFLIVAITLLGTNWTTVQDNFVKLLEFFR